MKKLISKEEIEEIVSNLAKQINNDYNGDDIIALCVLKGAVIFFTDLIRKLNLSVQIDFVEISSYNLSSQSSGNIVMKKDVQYDLFGKNVLIIEDIIDTGNTLSEYVAQLKKRQPKSVKTCCLLDKYQRRLKDIEIDYIGVKIPDEFVVGYGLDYAEKYRNLDSIYLLEKEDL